MTQHEQENSELASIFTRWLNQESVREDELMQLKMHPIWSERMLSYESITSMAQHAEQEMLSVPKWNKNSAFEQYLQQPSWWQKNGLSMAAFCFSFFACLIMIFDLRVNVSEQGLMIASNDTLQQVSLEKKFAELSRQNNDAIQQRLDSFQSMQQQSTAQLVSYVLDNSRSERKEDIQDVVDLLQQQRKDDMRFLREQFNDVNYNLKMAKFDGKTPDSSPTFLTE